MNAFLTSLLRSWAQMSPHYVNGKPTWSLLKKSRIRETISTGPSSFTQQIPITSTKRSALMRRCEI